MVAPGSNRVTEKKVALHRSPHEVRGVHRGSLLAALAAPLPPHTIRYDCRPVNIREGSRKGTTDVELEDGSVITTKVCKNVGRQTEPVV